MLKQIQMPVYTIKILDTLSPVDPATWNTISGTHNPFTRFEFLHALETEGCTTSAQGWQPHHLAFTDAAGSTVALLPAYIKTHSMGEYVFDWGWADAYQRHGLAYYPKLLSAVPFTPSIGPRLLYPPGSDPATVMQLHHDAAQALTSEATNMQASSWHLLFANEDSVSLLGGEENVMMRSGCQFRWKNNGYSIFEDFTDALVSRKRKMIRKERKAIADQGISFRHLPGTDITQADLDTFFVFYQATYLKRGQAPYLTRGFFQRIRETMPEQLHLVMAEHNGNDVAAALFFVNEDTLFGRYWGCLEEYDRLHFETCYYQGIELCISRNLRDFDAGAQGEHKILRGFEPIITRSCHWVAHPSFRAAIAGFLESETQNVVAYADEARSLLPYRDY